MTESRKNIFSRWKIIRWTPSRTLAVGFTMLILFGTGLLMLPFSSPAGHAVRFIDALFTSASAVCVTGLVVRGTATEWTWFGKGVILMLIQIGALGIMSTVTILSAVTGRELRLMERLTIRESIGGFTLRDTVGAFRRILAAAFAIEAMGAMLFMLVLVPDGGWLSGVGKSVFLSISAFCNAGFDLFGSPTDPYASLSGHADHPFLLMVVVILIIVGGLGFIVWQDIVGVVRRKGKLSLHAKVVLMMTGLLLLIGTAGWMVFESRGLLENYIWQDRLLHAFFQSTSARTAGFNTLPLEQMRDETFLLMILLMFIGAAPGSTGGGIKVTTVFILIAASWAFLQGRSEPHAFRRRIGLEALRRSITILTLNLTWVLVTCSVLLTIEDASFRDILFEVVSGFGTVGLGTGLTPNLQDSSKLMMVLTMLMGRIGTLTAWLAFTESREKEMVRFRYPEDRIHAG